MENNERRERVEKYGRNIHENIIHLTLLDLELAAFDDLCRPADVDPEIFDAAFKAAAKIRE